MKLGFCGVGRWASKIAEQFRACGAEIVAHDRKSPDAQTIGNGYHLSASFPGNPLVLDGFGTRRPWRDQLEDPRIDAIIAMADPETTTAVALACAAAGKPCLATKPLMVTEMPKLTAPLMVDFWRLWGDRWKRAREQLQEANPEWSATIAFYGRGPHRSFPGVFDYGPHAVAFALDAYQRNDSDALRNRLLSAKLGVYTEHESGDLLDVDLIFSRAFVRIRTGSGAETPKREIIMNPGKGPTTIWSEEFTTDKDIEIRAMCRSFVDDIAMGNADPYTLDLSIRGMRLLQEAREKAVAK